MFGRSSWTAHMSITNAHASFCNLSSLRDIYLRRPPRRTCSNQQDKKDMHPPNVFRRYIIRPPFRGNMRPNSTNVIAPEKSGCSSILSVNLPFFSLTIPYNKIHIQVHPQHENQYPISVIWVILIMIFCTSAI